MNKSVEEKIVVEQATIEAPLAPQVGEVELTLTYFIGLISRYRAHIFYTMLGLGIVWIFSQTKEVTALLLFSYFIALLIDPLIERAGQIGIKRPFAVALLLVSSVVLLVGFGATVAPLFFDGYNAFISNLPDYLRSAAKRIIALLSRFKVDIPKTPDELVESVTGHIEAVRGEHFRQIWSTFSSSLLSGYSFTLTIVNLVLFPFFFFYICTDLRKFHASIGRLMSHSARQTVREVGGEIIGHVRLFFRGQLLVALILTFLYVVGLSVIGLPYALVVGVLTGAMSIIPYFGIVIGVTTGILITLAYDPTWWGILKVVGVFLAINMFENNILAPKIIGGKLGIHPLGVMVAVIVGGQLLGLIGLILALPIVASVRVLLGRAVRELEEEPV